MYPFHRMSPLSLDGVSKETGTRGISAHTNAHDNKEAGEESSQVEHRRTATLDKVIRIRASAADPVRQRREDVGGDDEERVVDLVQGAGEDDEEESYGEDKGEGDDGLEAGGRHDEEVSLEDRVLWAASRRNEVRLGSE